MTFLPPPPPPRLLSPLHTCLMCHLWFHAGRCNWQVLAQQPNPPLEGVHVWVCVLCHSSQRWRDGGQVSSQVPLMLPEERWRMSDKWNLADQADHSHALPHSLFISSEFILLPQPPQNVAMWEELHTSRHSLTPTCARKVFQFDTDYWHCWVQRLPFN